MAGLGGLEHTDCGASLGLRVMRSQGASLAIGGSPVPKNADMDACRCHPRGVAEDDAIMHGQV